MSDERFPVTQEMIEAGLKACASEFELYSQPITKYSLPIIYRAMRAREPETLVNWLAKKELQELPVLGSNRTKLI